MKPTNSQLHLQLNNTTIIEPPKFKPTNQSTIAQLNCVSFKQKQLKTPYSINCPFRIRLPQYFNIPAFQDRQLMTVKGVSSSNSEKQSENIQKTMNSKVQSQQNQLKQKKVSITNKQDIIFKKRIKDLSILAQGMKRAKNIKQQSRYYFTQGVLYNNTQQYLKSIELFQKFLKIVLYLSDTKSIQLAFNVIGNSYMHLCQYQKALQFHEKQAQVSQRSDMFVSLINRGLCNQMIGNYGQARLLYQQAQRSLELELYSSDELLSKQKQRKQELLENLYERVEDKLGNNQLFMTQNIGQGSNSNINPKYKQISKIQDNQNISNPNTDSVIINSQITNTNNKQKHCSPNKSIKSSILKEQSILLLKNSSTRKQYEQNKVKYAIFAAEENIEQYLKNSIQYQQPK